MKKHCSVQQNGRCFETYCFCFDIFKAWKTSCRHFCGIRKQKTHKTSFQSSSSGWPKARLHRLEAQGLWFIGVGIFFWGMGKSVRCSKVEVRRLIPAYMCIYHISYFFLGIFKDFEEKNKLMKTPILNPQMAGCFFWAWNEVVKFPLCWGFGRCRKTVGCLRHLKPYKGRCRHNQICGRSGALRWIPHDTPTLLVPCGWCGISVCFLLEPLVFGRGKRIEILFNDDLKMNFDGKIDLRWISKRSQHLHTRTLIHHCRPCALNHLYCVCINMCYIYHYLILGQNYYLFWLVRTHTWVFPKIMESPNHPF